MSGLRTIYRAGMSTGWWEYVERLLASRDWRPSDLAEHAGIAQSVISRWKTDGAQPRVEALRDISTATGVPMLHLLVAAGHITPEEAALEDVDIAPHADALDVVAAIKADDRLLPEAKRHLTSQYGLLLRITAGVESEPADRPSAPPLRAVARKGTAAKKRGTGAGGST